MCGVVPVGVIPAAAPEACVTPIMVRVGTYILLPLGGKALFVMRMGGGIIVCHCHLQAFSVAPAMLLLIFPIMMRTVNRTGLVV